MKSCALYKFITTLRKPSNSLLLISAGAMFSFGMDFWGTCSAMVVIFPPAASTSSGSVTPGIVGRLQGGLREWGELRQCNKNFLS